MSQPSASFDAAAAVYDADLRAQSAVFHRIRSTIWRALFKHLPRGGPVLDLGCGTGQDSLFLAECGWSVLAVDPSAGMLAQLNEKARARGLSQRITTAQGSAGALDVALAGGMGLVSPSLAGQGARMFDGAVSSLGPLNCEGDLTQVAQALAAAVRPGGVLVLSPMARVCPWEIARFLAGGQPSRAFARLGAGPIPAPVSAAAAGVSIPTWYRSSAAFLRPFLPAFEMVEQRGLAVFVPPPYMRGAQRWRSALDLAGALDEALAHRWPLSGLGDHTLFVLRRRA